MAASVAFVAGVSRPSRVFGSSTMARLQQFYQDVVIPKLSEKLGVKNRHALPRLTKIVISMGVGKAVQ